jgi:hypothetical protein
MSFESQNQGLKDLVEVIDFVFLAKDAFNEAKANDGKITLRDFPIVLGIFDDADDAITGIENIPAAWQEATTEERLAVVQYFNAKFDIPNDRVEEKIEKALQGILFLYEAAIA